MANQKTTILKQGVQETLIIPLVARKMCTELYPTIFQDPYAIQLIDKLDYDFTDINNKMNTLMGRFGALETAMRQYDLACEVKSYLQDHPYASIVNIGCGLDQTGENCDNGLCKIYNLDFPDVIDVRNALIEKNECTTNLSVNLNDKEWFTKIDQTNGVVFIAAGVFYYFKTEEVKQLFQTMNTHFHGCKLVFDAAGKKAVKIMISQWVKKAGMTSVNAYFYVDDLDKDLKAWLNASSISAKGYMLGYHDLNDSSISPLFRMMSKIADHVMKMKIIRIDF